MQPHRHTMFGFTMTALVLTRWQTDLGSGYTCSINPAQQWTTDNFNNLQRQLSKRRKDNTIHYVVPLVLLQNYPGLSRPKTSPAYRQNRDNWPKPSSGLDLHSLYSMFNLTKVNKKTFEMYFDNSEILVCVDIIKPTAWSFEGSFSYGNDRLLDM